MPGRTHRNIGNSKSVVKETTNGPVAGSVVFPNEKENVEMKSTCLKPNPESPRSTAGKPLNAILSKYTVLLAAGLVLLFTANIANAQVAMAPPVSGAAGAAPSGNSVFNWTEVPQNQDVPITRAAFDQGGYQLYDTAGETIVVPFANNNLYVMKFAESTDGQIHFYNTGTAPVLYIPHGVGIENAADPGTFWYPLPANYHPHVPVFIGIAPSWDLFIGMGWYPGMCVYGGYWWNIGVPICPMFGLYFDFGGHRWHGWDGYYGYYRAHGAPFHTSYWHRSVYTMAGNPGGGHRTFGGRNGATGAGGHRTFGAGAVAGAAHHTFGAAADLSTHGTGGRTFRGASSSFGGGHSFSGGTHAIGGSARSFRGATVSGGTHSFGGGGSFSGGNRSFKGGTTGAPHFSGGGHSFSGGSAGVSGHSFGGGATGGGHPAGAGAGGGHSFGGAPAGGGHGAGGGGDRHGH